MLIADHRQRDIPHRDAAPGAPLPPVASELLLRSPGWDRNLMRYGDWEGGPDGLASAPGRALRCVWTGIESGWAHGSGSPL